MERGADLGVRLKAKAKEKKTSEGATPADLAERGGHLDVAQYLREAETRAAQNSPSAASSPSLGLPAAAPNKATEPPPPPIY